MPDPLLGALVAFAISVLTAPAGVSGGVLLLPVQISLLGVAPGVATPTNFVYNVIAAPGAVLRYWRAGRLSLRLFGAIAAGGLPGTVVGIVVRVHYVRGASFLLVVALVLLPVGAWLVASRASAAGRRAPSDAPALVAAAAFALSVVGGIYGLGGGAIVVPALLGLGMGIQDVAGATLATTCLASALGVATYEALVRLDPPVAQPDWALAAGAGLGGLFGSYAGAYLQPHLPARAIRLGLGAVLLATGLWYLARSAGA